MKYFNSFSDTYSNDDSASNTQNIILTADDAVTELLFQTEEEEPDENEYTEPIESDTQDQQSQNESHHLLDEKPLATDELKNLKFACEICHKRFAENKILKRHLKIHSPNKPHVCTVCNMSFAESSNLTKHKKKHTGELRNVVGKPNLCSVCGEWMWISHVFKTLNLFFVVPCRQRIQMGELVVKTHETPHETQNLKLPVLSKVLCRS